VVCAIPAGVEGSPAVLAERVPFSLKAFALFPGQVCGRAETDNIVGAGAAEAAGALLTQAETQGATHERQREMVQAEHAVPAMPATRGAAGENRQKQEHDRAAGTYSCHAGNLIKTISPGQTRIVTTGWK
jgi:hypothetical protein